MARRSTNQIDRIEKIDAELAQHTLDSIGASPAEVEQYKTPEAILAARLAEKQQIMATQQPAAPEPAAPEPATAPIVAGGDKASALDQLLGRLASAGTPKVDTERRDALRAEAQPHLTAIKSAMTSHGMLKSKWLAAVEAVALRDWAAIRAGTPPKLVFANGRNTDVALHALVRLQRAADTARGTLTSSFGDSMPGRDEIDPVNAQGAAENVEALLAGDGWLHRGTGEVSQTYKRALSHLKVWAERAQRTADSARVAVEQFQAAQKYAEEILADVAPVAVPPPMPKTVAALPPTPPTRSASSYTDFDPREPARPVDDGVVVTDIGAGAGKRVSRRA